MHDPATSEASDWHLREAADQAATHYVAGRACSASRSSGDTREGATRSFSGSYLRFLEYGKSQVHAQIRIAAQ